MPQAALPRSARIIGVRVDLSGPAQAARLPRVVSLASPARPITFFASYTPTNQRKSATATSSDAAIKAVMEFNLASV